VDALRHNTWFGKQGVFTKQKVIKAKKEEMKFIKDLEEKKKATMIDKSLVNLDMKSENGDIYSEKDIDMNSVYGEVIENGHLNEE